mgnify:FL=1|tara:strand:- start:34 stop:492 length:459 start_codon:yes stop_codon:yes gene_type:complete
MKLLFENWRKYLSEGFKYIVQVPQRAVVQKGDSGDKLFLFSGQSFEPLSHIDIGQLDGITARSARDWPGGVEHLRGWYKEHVEEQLRRDPDWIKVVLDPKQAEEILRQFQVLRNKIYKDYENAGVAGPLFDDNFKRNHPVDINLQTLKVTLK